MSTTLPKQLQPALKSLEKDLLARAKSPNAEDGLRRTWEEETKEGRTGQGFDPWRREKVTQIAVAWILSVVFVRTLEDRAFIDPRVGGKDDEALRRAEDREALFLQLAPFLGPREYLLAVFRELSKLPGARHVFDTQRNPVWVLSPSSEGARALIDFFRKRDAEGRPLLAFTGEDTRFLGDLYQDLSEDVRKRYALLQTPEFVEEFILDQTLDPAIREFGLEEVRLIDPTCGSGHFLLGAFRRLLSHWRKTNPLDPIETLARKALDQVYGVDINPYAVAIARFRLVLEVLNALGIDRLERAPDLRPRLAVADSLLHRFEAEEDGRKGQLSFDEASQFGDALFRLENLAEVKQVLARRFHAVVGNPPFIQEKDAKKREAYRKSYASASGKYALSAPFTERFFELAVTDGFVGLINSNAWTKRDFGKALIEEVLTKLDLQKVVDTSGCYIPGHGTPTLLLFGRNRAPAGDSVIAALGKRGERIEPSDPATAPVWSEILAHHDHVGFDGNHISIEHLERAELKSPPWVLAGGGARALLQRLGSESVRLDKHAEDIGFASFTGSDDAFLLPPGSPLSKSSPSGFVRDFVTGDAIRDWNLVPDSCAIAPYGADHELVSLEALGSAAKHFWMLRRSILATTGFGGETRGEAGDSYWGWYRWISSRYRIPFRLSFAFVATHNHFVLDRGGRVFNRHAPIIKLHERHDESDHQALLGYLNSSTAGFWCRLVMFPKGGDQVGDGARLSATQWNRHLEYAGNLLQQLPVPDLGKLRESLLPLVIAAEETVKRLGDLVPDKVLTSALADAPSLDRLRAAREQMKAERARLRGILVSLQEEMDWRVYGIFGLPTVTAPSLESVHVPVAPEHRPFEVRLAREVDSDISASEWFRIHQRTPPYDVAGPLAELYRQRVRLLDDPERGKDLRLLETPETKRRWPPPHDDKAFLEAARSWLLDRIEQVFREQPQPELGTARQVAFDLGQDAQVVAVAELLTADSGHDLVRLISDLVDAEGVPFLAAHRYTESGLEKRRIWEDTWELQRAEDEGTLDQALKARNLKAIPVPDKYAKPDFQRHFESLRGALDVPKERFTAVPGGNADEDPTPLFGWAGWDHLKTAQALSGLYQRRKVEDGWAKEKLLPLLAGIHERVPWLLQWHNEPSESFGGMRLGQFFKDFVGSEAHALGIGTGDLIDWRPERAAKKAKAEPKAKNASAKKPAVSLEEVLAALRTWPAPDAAPAELAQTLAATEAITKKHLKALVDAGQVEQTRGRPQRFRART